MKLLFDLKLVGSNNSSLNRKKVSEALMIGNTNAKQFLNRINMLKLSREELLHKIKEILNEK